jgi:hypothetical protein
MASEPTWDSTPMGFLSAREIALDNDSLAGIYLVYYDSLSAMIPCSMQL